MTQATLQRLLKYPHAAAFEKAPDAELAFRVRNPAGLVWEVTGTTLHLVTGKSMFWDGAQSFDGNYDWGLTLRDYSLLNKTVGQLADELRADGHDVVFENPDLSSRGAAVLIAAKGDQDVSNGDNVQAYTSLLWCLLGSYAGELNEASVQVREALRQMIVGQAEGYWLDLWARLYDVPRLPGETDASLQVRIGKEAFRVRVNGIGIEQAISDATGETVQIKEPWHQLFELDVSALSGTHHLQDGQYYTYHVIQPVGAEGTDWSRVMPVIERNKAAGIDIYAPRVRHGARHITVQPPVEYRIERGIEESRGSGIYGTSEQILGVMRLSDNQITINHLCNRHDWWVKTEADGLKTDQQIEPHRTIAMANIILSDGDALGEENAILSRGAERVTFDPEPIPSELMYLSGYSATHVVERVEAVSTQAHMMDAASAFTANPGDVAHTGVRAYASNEAYPLRYWTGSWGNYPWLPDWRVAGSKRTDTPL